MMRRLLLGCVMALCLAVPSARAADDEEKKPNAKYEGYKVPVKGEESSQFLTYGMLVLAAGLCVAVMFKDAKRSHLD